MTHIDPQLLLAKAGRIRLLVTDVDGVLTDGSIIYNGQGEQIQIFHVHDGLGLNLLRKAGIEVAIISSRSSRALATRASELGIDKVFQGHNDKIAVYQGLLNELNIRDQEACYIGDDWVDLPLLKRVGFSVTVLDAPPPLHDYVDYVTGKNGGRRAVREVCDLILRAKNKWAALLNEIINSSLD